MMLVGCSKKDKELIFFVYLWGRWLSLTNKRLFIRAVSESDYNGKVMIERIADRQLCHRLNPAFVLAEPKVVSGFVAPYGQGHKVFGRELRKAFCNRHVKPNVEVTGDQNTKRMDAFGRPR